MDIQKVPTEDNIPEDEAAEMGFWDSGAENAPKSTQATSPGWGSTTKLIVGLSLVAISAFLLFRFLNFVGPLLLAFIFAYLFYPVAELAQVRLRIPWRITVTLLYLILAVLLISSITMGGITMLEQVQNLIRFLENALRGLPQFIDEITGQPLIIGPFTINTELLDANAVIQQVLNVVQPLLTQAGSSVVSFASSAATAIGWMFFVLLVSYFILVETGGIPNRLFSVSIPGHDEDVRRLGIALNRIWNAFLRGQITIVLLTIMIYTFLLGGLGVRFFFGLALLAGLARFVPYVGTFVTWTTYGLVAFFQAHTIFGLSSLAYVGLVVGSAWLFDLFLDNFVTPRLMSNALRVHPAAVMISALVAFNLLGIIGVVLAAPVLATMKLFVDYIFAKLFDQDPWVNMETIPGPNRLPPLLPLMQERYDQFRERVGKVSIPRIK
jgi:predicted PurR-regulated permease PerM